MIYLLTESLLGNWLTPRESLYLNEKRKLTYIIEVASRVVQIRLSIKKMVLNLQCQVLDTFIVKYCQL